MSTAVNKYKIPSLHRDILIDKCAGFDEFEIAYLYSLSAKSILQIIDRTVCAILNIPIRHVDSHYIDVNKEIIFDALA